MNVGQKRSEANSSGRYRESTSLQDCGCSIIRSGTLLHCTAAKDFLGNGRVRGPRGDRLGVGNPPRARTRYPLPVVSATLVARMPPRGFWTNGESIKRPLCEE
ncbi:PREDICTED: uncharacterized protein LOC105566085 [Vollenhovia emeryi]|uniref:uncharacterized protein LOC105566085 n=1 Tax=Vollenhovia emeryi TaxID=411798 RepID=UPI0005F55641|nr:PREDICTED: uncharacterized protein LOC105566085 [Vollenhovia emeryi]